MARFRSHGWEPEELKIYWNAKQLENLCPQYDTEENGKQNLKAEGETKDEVKNVTEAEVNIESTDEVKTETKDEAIVEKADEATNETKISAKAEYLPPHDPSDADVVLALREYPVSNRNHECTITYVHKGIEKAVFDAPEDAQLIVLNFAVSYFLKIILNHDIEIF
jgi:hypothetical protein